ncbi:hypothetical protein CAEBREN_17388 [Caenorhabditis brenneri]|uniref:Sdz-33 F-box domain-containing protein n=1 Tax=Caenorhabditis brenneri TaxID=135651 RepID=G0N2F4_CAEBE|nr:hypothetical protein CAEBREN_17388 [Caenorhabditis brenneri]
MSSFPVLNLPIVAHKVAIRQLDIGVIIHLSLLYRKFKESVNKFKLRALRFDLILHNPPCNFMKINLHFHGDVIICFELKEGENRDPWIQKSGNQFIIPCGRTYGCQEQVLKQLTQSLHEIIRVQKYDFMATQVSLDSVMNCFIWKFSKKFRSFTYSQNDVDKVVNSGHLKFLLETITVESMSLTLKTDHNRLEYEPKELKHNELKLHFKNSILFKTFLKMQCKAVHIGMPTTTSENIVSFVKSWLSGNLENLEAFSVEIQNDIFNERAVFKELADWLIQYPEDHLQHNSITPCVKHIKRSDGKVAELKFHFLKKFIFTTI